MPTYWGIDLGGTKIEAAVLPSLDDTETLCRKRIDTNSERGYEHILSRIKELVENVSSELGESPTRLGIAHPGAIDSKTSLLKNSNTTCMNGMPLQADLERELGIPVLMANDANCFALAEARFGAAKGAKVVFGIILGTGVGGGIVIDGKVLEGHHGIAGEWGHTILVPNGEPCYCGKRGCVETVISGPALEAHYQQLSGSQRPLTEIASLASTGQDKHALATIACFEDNFAKALSYVTNILDPDCVVVGGGVSNVDALYANAKQKLAPYLFNSSVEVEIVKNQLGDSAGVFGAALLTG